MCVRGLGAMAHRGRTEPSLCSLFLLSSLSLQRLDGGSAVRMAALTPVSASTPPSMLRWLTGWRYRQGPVETAG